MSLDRTTSSTEMATSVLTLKAELGLSTALTSEDTRLTALILRAQEWAEGYVGYPLLAQRYRETLAGYGSRNLMLARTPVRNVRSLFYGTATGDDATLIGSSEFGLEDKAGFLTRNYGWDWSVPVQPQLSLAPIPGQEFEPWLADYVAGWTLDGVSTASALWSTEKGTTSTGRTLPYDVEQAVLLKAQSFYSALEDVTEKAVGDLRIKYATQAVGGGRVDAAAALLARYRRVA